MATLEIKAVEMTRSIRDTQHEQLKGKTWDERVAFFKEQVRPFTKSSMGCGTRCPTGLVI